MISKTQQLMALSQELGREDRHLAILGEGNTSCRANPGTFFVKASGSSLSTLAETDLTECRLADLLPWLDRDDATDDEINNALSASQVDPTARRPSTEAIFHAYLLSLNDIHWVGHTHPVAINGILCSPRARDFADRRLFPDDVVCCGSKSLLLPYVDPGLSLAREIRTGVTQFHGRHGKLPKVILLQNHGLIAMAAGPAGVLAATRMAVKSAEIFTRATALGGPVFMSDDDVNRIENRSDEHYRRKVLGV